jgi:hypothetical protein
VKVAHAEAAASNEGANQLIGFDVRLGAYSRRVCTDDLEAENARLLAEVEDLRRKLYGPTGHPPEPPSSGSPTEPEKPVVVYLQPRRDWEPPDAGRGLGAEAARRVTAAFARIQSERHPEWDVRVMDDDDLNLIPVGATVLRSVVANAQWVAERDDDEVTLRRVVRDEDRALLGEAGALVDSMRAHVDAAQSAGPMREGQRHLLVADVYHARFGLALALWNSGEDKKLRELLDEEGLD